MANTNRNFSEILADIDSGVLLEMLSAASAQIANGVLATGKAGTLTLTLKYKVNKNNSLFVESNIKKAIPELGIETATFFADEDGNLTRRNPQQQELFGTLREVK